MGPSRLAEEGQEVSHPTVDSAAVDSEGALGQPLDDIGAAEAIPGVPLDGERDHAIRKGKVREGTLRASSETTAVLVATPSLAS
jgi:hypothetical protein